MACALSAPATAQTPPWSGASSLERHRYETGRLRADSDLREVEASLQRLETQQRLYELEAARRPPPELQPLYSQPDSPEQAQAAREAATRRRQDVVSGATQIDDWLYRSPR